MIELVRHYMDKLGNKLHRAHRVDVAELEVECYVIELERILQGNKSHSSYLDEMRQSAMKAIDVTKDRVAFDYISALEDDLAGAGDKQELKRLREAYEE